MSFILDALKKSETERQNQAGPGISTTPRAGRHAPLPRWAMALIGALALLAMGLGWAWWQSGRSPPVASSANVSSPDPAPPPAPAGGPVRSLAAEARSQVRPAATVVGTPAASPSPQAQPDPGTRLTETTRPTPSSTASLPSNADLAVQGITLPNMHLDIHVFSNNAAERFVFINTLKYREGDRLRDGPRVMEITPEGVVLNHQGTSFLLPRD